MSAIPLSTLVRKGLDLGFDLGGKIVKRMVLGRGVVSGVIAPGQFQVVVTGLVTNYKTGDIPGTMLLLGDEKVMIRAKEVDGLMRPAAGDRLEEIDGSVRREIIAVMADPTASFWVCQTRRLDESMRVNAGVKVAAGGDLIRRAAEMLVRLKFRASAPDIKGVDHLNGGGVVTLGASGTLDFPEGIHLMIYGRTSLAVDEETSYWPFLHLGGGVVIELPTAPDWYVSNSHLLLVYLGIGAQARGGSVGDAELHAEYTYEGNLYVSNIITVAVG